MLTYNKLEKAFDIMATDWAKSACTFNTNIPQDLYNELIYEVKETIKKHALSKADQITNDENTDHEWKIDF